MISVTRDKNISRRILPYDDSATSGVRNAVFEILKNVYENGDTALLDYTEKFDGIRPQELEVSRNEIDNLASKVPAEVISSLQKAYDRIYRYHSAQLRQGFRIETDNEVLIQRVIPLKRVGLYVPGGTAPYPSTVLMDAIPAKIAGVSELIMVSPPTCEGDISPLIAAAAKLAGVTRIFRCGGAQAIAALAYGTETIPAVDKIVGPGNVYVAEAKKQVFGTVGIDLVSGPSEVVIVAEGDSDVDAIAADMLAQAEHDTLSPVILITPSEELAYSVQKALDLQLSSLPRREIAENALNSLGRIIVCDSIEEGISIANDFAPEHLELMSNRAFDYLDLIENAGSVFLGKYSMVPIGDYIGGTNHALPTGGSARFASPLSVDDFVKKSSFSYFTETGLNSIKDDIAVLARAEGFEGHARSALSRKNAGN